MQYRITIHYTAEYNLADYTEQLEKLRERTGKETLDRWQILEFLQEKFCDLLDTNTIRDNLDIEEIEEWEDNANN